MKDLEVIIKALDNEVFSSHSVVHIVKDIFGLCQVYYKPSFSLRQGNSMAHALAQRVRFSFLVFVWIEDVPQDILCFVSSDFPRVE